MSGEPVLAGAAAARYCLGRVASLSKPGTVMTSSATSVSPAAVDSASPTVVQVPQRLVSLDALRGFDMFWIIGGEEIFHALNQATEGQPSHRTFEFIAWQLTHKNWEGFGFYDLIFPMFVFMVGASLVFSLGKLIATKGRERALLRVIMRGVALYLLGLVYYAWSYKGYHDVRLMGVLQRIALAYFFAGLLFCLLKPRTLAYVTVSLLVVYWGLLTFVRAPGESHVSFAEGHNLTNWIDAHYLPGFKWDGDHDPEGLLSTIPAVASCLLGVFAGLLLKEGKMRPILKVLLLIGAGAVSVALGLLWGLQFPVIKKLWTSSFVLVAGGYSAILLGLFYLVIDVWNIRGWCAPFVWIGMNAITLYFVEHLFNFRGLAERFVGGEFGRHAFKGYQPLASALLAMFFVLLLARFLYKRQIFLRV